MAKIGRPRRDEPSKKKQIVIAGPVRTGGRVKKAKIVFDPSNTISSSSSYRKRQADRSGDVSDPSNIDQCRSEKKLRKNSSSGSIKLRDDNVCSECSRSEFKKCKQLFSCRDCSFKVHPICLKIQFDDVDLLKANFRCDDCKTCSACYDGTEEGPLVTCGKCTNSYHYGCHVPKIMLQLVDTNNWFCTKCIAKKNTSIEIRKSEIIAATPLLSKTAIAPASSCDKVPSICNIRPQINSPLNVDTVKSESQDQHQLQLKEIPNITGWSTTDVTEFFKLYFPKYSHIFKENDIDGISLLSMKRSDIIGKMTLKLGPSLKIYNLVLVLQTGCSDITQSWTQ